MIVSGNLGLSARSRFSSAIFEGDETYAFDISGDSPVTQDLGDGDDAVLVSADDTVDQVRVTFTSAEVGNGNANDSGALANQDGGLAVRLQAEDGSGDLTGPVSRFDDEGIRFVSDGSFTFDVRDLVSGVSRGDQFDVVELGLNGRDVEDRTGEQENYYINAGMGNDRLTGGDGDDFLVGGAGRDRLYGRQGNDSFIGGGGDDAVFGGNGDDIAIINTAADGSDMVNLGRGSDTVNVGALAAAGQIRLTFTSAEVGNNSGSDSGTLANQDGGLAVRLQAEDGMGNLAGAISRLDDEGVRFVSTTPGVTFDVRDLVSGLARGDQFDVVELGTSGRDVVDKRGADIAYYINAGMGDDRLTGGESNDFLVGGTGKDRLYGEGGDDSLIGGMGEDAFVFSSNPGNDTILDFASGTDKIVLTSFDIDFSDIQMMTAGANTTLDIDADEDGMYDFQVTLMNTAAPQEGDFVFL
jgi:Ca2+-binding RTX toxin-like protein